MIIKKVKIENFLSYFDNKTFEFSNGLNIILGENGEGKTKFFDAVEWLLQDNNTEKDKFISKKRLEHAEKGEVFNVSVQIEIEQNNESTTFFKSFEVEKINNVEFKTFKIDFVAIEDRANGERVKTEGTEATNLLNFLFPNQIRKYSMFRGESSLNIFRKKDSNAQDNALINLVNLFSDSNLYQKYSTKANALKNISNTERSDYNKVNAKNKREYDVLDGLINKGQHDVHKIKDIIKDLHENIESTKFKKDGLDKYIKNAKANEEINERISNFETKKKNLDNQIDEQYNIPLLDDLWILMNFEEIHKEFAKKISDADESRRSLQQQFDIQKGETKGRREVQAKLLNDTTPLPIGTPDRKTMQEMLKDEICKVCNRPALVGSDAYNYMEANLKEFLTSLEPADSVEIDELLFKQNYIRSLVTMTSVHENYITKFRQVETDIKDKFELNEAKKEAAHNFQIQIDNAHADKLKIFGDIDQSDDKLSIIASNYTNWTNDIINGEKVLSKHQLDFDRELKSLNENKRKRDEIDLESGNTLYDKKYNLLNDIDKIFIDIKDRKFDEYIHKLEEKSNEIFQKINIDSFIGKIKFILSRIVDKVDVKVELVQNDDTHVTSPNQALETSMHLSVLFAISELASEKKKEDYPLIFDAPTSSFGESKTASFLNVLNENKNQKILLLKDFISRDQNQNLTIKPDFKKVKRNKAFWVKLERPFDKGLLHTINTIIEEIN
jgi:DNA sulfur modification protein DndD